MYRIGNGIDFHKLVQEPFRPLRLGGYEINTEYALLGHSDADIVLHSIGDALLGSMSLGDIGDHFPDTDPQYKNMDSRMIVEKCLEHLEHRGFRICNLDITIVAENPKIAPFRQEIRQSIASILKIPVLDVSLKATTSEGMGALGRSEGVMVFTTVLVHKKS